VVNQTTFRQLRSADFHQIWSRNIFRCLAAESGNTFSKIFTLGVICPQNLKSKIGQTNTSLRADILFTPRCSPRAREFPTCGQYFCTMYGCGACNEASNLLNFRILAYFPDTKPQKHTFRWPAYSPGVHLRMTPLFPCDSRRFRRCSFPATSGRGAGDPQTCPNFRLWQMSIYTECNCTARQIWTKDVWKRAILRTDVPFHHISSPLPPKSPKNPILGNLSMQNLLHR